MSPIPSDTTGDRTLRLLIDWPIDGVHLRGWIVRRDVRSAALLVARGFAEYVLDGTSPPPSQMEWARSLVKESEHAHPDPD